MRDDEFMHGAGHHAETGSDVCWCEPTAEDALSRVVDTLLQHERQITPELLRCACGWYVERGERVAHAHAVHVAAALVSGGAV